MQIGNKENRWLRLLCWAVSLSLAGCASTRMTETARSGMEQLLVSNAIDTSLDKIDFDSLAGAAVFVDEKQLECSDKKYIVGSVRQRIFQAGCRVVEKADEADVIVELCSGAVGTDRSEGFIGTPALSVPGPVPVQIPEIKLFSQTSQYGTAKISMIAYDARTKQALSPGALTRARSNNSNWSLMGIGPFGSGTIRDELARSKKRHDAEPQVLLSNQQPPRYSQQALAGTSSSTSSASPKSKSQPAVDSTPNDEPRVASGADRVPDTPTTSQ